MATNSAAMMIVAVTFGSLLVCLQAERPQLIDSIRRVEVRAHGHLHLKSNSSSGNCLCSFDIDRTLTGKQSETRTCPYNEVVPGVRDSAYSNLCAGGKCDLTWSKLGKDIGQTFCKNCYLALVSAGNAGGRNSQERRKLVEKLKASGGKVISEEWSGPSKNNGGRRNCGSAAHWYPSTLVVGCEDGSKQEAVKGILSMLKRKGIVIPKDRVYHYDDRVGNILKFQGTGFNAQQISCKFREENGGIGMCGADGSLVKEETKGVHQCAPPKMCDPGGPIWNAKVSCSGGGKCGDHIMFLVNDRKMDLDAAKKKVSEECNECKDCAPEEDVVDDETGEGAHNPDGPGTDTNEDGDGFEEFKGKKVKCPADKAEANKLYSIEKTDVSVDVCKQTCTEETDCKCMVYSKTEKKCWVATKCDKEDWEDDAKYDLYFKSDDDSGNPRYKTLDNHNAFGPDNGAVNLQFAPKEPLSPAGCMAWCSDVKECECATYHVDGKKCWLRKQCDPTKMTKYGEGFDVFMKLKDSEVESNDGDSSDPEPAPTPTPSGDDGSEPAPAPPPAAPKDCKTATASNGMNNCYQACTWAKNNGVKRNPATYEGLTALSPFEDFQNWMHDQEEQQGCTVKACDPPPQQPPGVNIRVTPALPSRGENKVRVSMVRYAGTVSPDKGDVKWTYNRQFLHRWTGCHLKSAIVDVVPGQPNNFNLDGTQVSIKIPKKDDGVVMFLMADPKFNDGMGKQYNILGLTHDILNKMAGEIDYWSVIGDNWYDITGGYHKQVFSGLSLNASVIPFSAVMGNHDYMIRSFWDYRTEDSFGFGHTQWYALDTMAGKANEAEPFNFANGPPTRNGMRQWEVAKHITTKDNQFFYHSVGNVMVIGYCAIFSWEEMASWFEEACHAAGTAGSKVVAVLGHWDANNLGSKLSTPNAVGRVRNLQGCSGKIVKGVMGHRHDNQKVGNDNFLIGGWGYSHGACDGSLGIPFLDTRGGRAKFKWFQFVKWKRWMPRGKEMLACLQSKGVVAECEYPGHFQLWMDEPLH